MKSKAVVAAVIVAMTGWAAEAAAQSADVAKFYKDKQINFYVGFAPGGGYDEYSRMTARYMGKYIPGNPKFVVVNKPGAGSVLLANELYTSMPKDGTAVGMFSSGLQLWELLGQANIRFNSNKFNWVGRITDSDDVMAIRPDRPVKAFDGARQHELTIGIPGANSSTALVVTAVNNLLGTKFRLISGYAGSAEIRLALERGEVDGNQSLLWSVDQAWAKKNNLIMLYKVVDADLPGLEGVPSLISLTKGEDEKKLMNFFTSYAAFGRPVAAPPDVPPDHLAALRNAFMKTMEDPDFLRDIQKADMRLSPMSGKELQALIAATFDLSDDLKQRARAVANMAAEEKK